VPESIVRLYLVDVMSMVQRGDVWPRALGGHGRANLAIDARLRGCAQQTYSQGEENCSSSRSTERRGVSIA
jgi:hypothetical protein